MLFNSMAFIIFFIVVTLLYYVCPKKIRYIWLLACSYIFYFSQSAHFVVLLITTTVITYIAGLLLYKYSDVKIKNCIVGISFVINVGIIVYLKYTDFFLEMFNSGKRFNFVVPIGISFYTLQALSYIMDCYREKLEPEKNILRYALFVSFFPSMLSGPINRGRDLLPELRCAKNLELDNVKEGLQKMLWGYFLKLVIAARLTILVDTAYANADGYSGVSLLIAAIAYLFMLYCDFEGYSQIAIGASRILGITVLENFKQPFFATSMSELWHRWHISLSTWLREYLYFPLGGNRKGTTRKYINMMIVMFVSGLWHGANYTFIIWGILNGLFLVVGNALIDKRDAVARKCNLYDTRIRIVLQRIGVYLLYAFSFIFFAQDNIQNAFLIVSRIFTRFNVSGLVNGEIFSLGLGMANLGFIIVMCVFVMFIDGYCNRMKTDIVGLFKVMPLVVRWGIYLAVVTMIVFSANLSGKEFIYSKM